ncbi:ABC transporter permease [Chloroflexota bacterium]
MSLKRIGILALKDLMHGSRSFLIIFVIILPLLMWLIVTLIFGGTSLSRLGIVDEGNSQLPAMVLKLDSIELKEYAVASDLTRAVENGNLDAGIVLPAGFDDMATAGNSNLIVYMWGESLAKNRIILQSTISNMVRELAGQDTPVQIQSVAIGEGESIPWSQRLTPFIVVMPIVMGGIYLTATAVVQEKERKTLNALVVTPASLTEVYLAKALLGFVFSLVMGIAILLLNNALGNEPWLLLLFMALGTVMAVELGLIFSSFVNNVTTLFATARIAQIIIFVPALFYMFPWFPQWVAKIFPSYYFIQPIMDISQGSATWSDIFTSVFVLIGVNMIIGVIAWQMIKRIKQFAA